MALPLNRALFNRFAGAQIRRGWSSNRILARATTLGFGVSRTFGLSSIRGFRGVVRGETLLRAAIPSEPLSSFAMVRGEFRNDRRFRINGRQTLLNTETGETEVRFWSSFSMENRGADGWAQAYIGSHLETYLADSFEIVGAEVLSVELNRGWSAV